MKVPFKFPRRGLRVSHDGHDIMKQHCAEGSIRGARGGGAAAAATAGGGGAAAAALEGAAQGIRKQVREVPRLVADKLQHLCKEGNVGCIFIA